MKTRAYISMDELVFENRNQQYGAYYLRMRNNRITAVSLFAALTICAMMIAGPMMKKKPQPNILPPVNIDSVVVSGYDPNDHVKYKKPPVEPMETLLEKTIKRTIPQITKEDVNPIDIATDADMDSAQSGTKTIAGTLFGNLDSDNAGKSAKSNHKDSVPEWEIIEKAKFPGGQDALALFVKNNIRFPEEAIEYDVQGVVQVRFAVDEEGVISNIKIIRSNLDDQCNKEAIEVIKKMPRWEPAKYNGKNIRSFINLPIRYEIKK